MTRDDPQLAFAKRPSLVRRLANALGPLLALIAIILGFAAASQKVTVIIESMGSGSVQIR